eukprot:2643190-Pleurochrysis_carterae.AAC.1
MLSGGPCSSRSLPPAARYVGAASLCRPRRRARRKLLRRVGLLQAARAGEGAASRRQYLQTR